MLLITKKKKKHIAAHLGFLWFYIRRIENPRDFVNAAEAFTDLCVDFKINWMWVVQEANRYERVWRNVDAIKRGIGNGE